MMHTALLQQVIPTLVTSVALQYPIAYIKSISFHLHNKVIAACFWHEQSTPHSTAHIIADRDKHSGCVVFSSTEHIRECEVEINGTDERGQDFVISIPYKRIMSRRVA